MASPHLQLRARLRLRENVDSPGCLDLSRHSSSLLSPSLYPQLSVFSHDSLENEFPFQVSPAESFTRSTHKGTAATPQLAHSTSGVKHQEAAYKLAGTPLAAVTNTVIGTAQSLNTAVSPDSLWQTPVADQFQPSLQTPNQDQVHMYLQDIQFQMVLQTINLDWSASDHMMNKRFHSVLTQHSLEVLHTMHVAYTDFPLKLLAGPGGIDE